MNAPAATGSRTKPLPTKKATNLRRCGILLAPVLLLLLAGTSCEAEGPQDEYTVKAAYLFSFAKYVEWPQASLPDATTSISFGILGQNPFGDRIEHVIGDRKIDNRSITLKRSEKPEELTNCHLLFVCRSEEEGLPEILKKMKGAPILTISDCPGFCQLGGMIRLYLEERKVRFEINNAAATEAELKISSKLLRLAKLASTEKQDKDDI